MAGDDQTYTQFDLDVFPYMVGVIRRRRRWRWRITARTQTGQIVLWRVGTGYLTVEEASRAALAAHSDTVCVPDADADAVTELR